MNSLNHKKCKWKFAVWRRKRGGGQWVTQHVPLSPTHSQLGTPCSTASRNWGPIRHKTPPLQKRDWKWHSIKRNLFKNSAAKRRWEQKSRLQFVRLNTMQRKPWAGWDSETDFDDMGWAFACKKWLTGCSFFLDFGKSIYFHEKKAEKGKQMKDLFESCLKMCELFFYSYICQSSL